MAGSSTERIGGIGQAIVQKNVSSHFPGWVSRAEVGKRHRRGLAGARRRLQADGPRRARQRSLLSPG